MNCYLLFLSSPRRGHRHNSGSSSSHVSCQIYTDEGRNQTPLSKSCYFPPAARLLFHIFLRSYGCRSTNTREPGPTLRAPKITIFLNTGYSLAGTSEHRAQARVFSFSPVSSALLCNYWRHCWQRSRPCGQRGQTDGTVFPWYPFTHVHAAPHADRPASWLAEASGGSRWENVYAQNAG